MVNYYTSTNMHSSFITHSSILILYKLYKTAAQNFAFFGIVPTLVIILTTGTNKAYTFNLKSCTSVDTIQNNFLTKGRGNSYAEPFS